MKNCLTPVFAYPTMCLIFLVAACVALVSAPALGQVITKGEVTVYPIPGTVIEYEFDFEILVGDGWRECGRIEIYNRGFGSMTIANLDVLVYDDNPGNLVSIDGGMVHTEFADVNDDGFKDLTLCARVFQHEGGKGDSILQSRIESAVFIANPITKRFERRYGSALFPDNDEKLPKNARIRACIGHDALRTAFYRGSKDGLWKKKVPLHKNEKIAATFRMEKRNDGYPHLRGLLSISNLGLYVYENRDDFGWCYENEMLHTDFVDVTGDGYTDLVLSGRVIYSSQGDKQDELAYEPVLFIYVYDPAKKGFRLGYKKASFDINNVAPLE